ncbi:MAG: VOC family protein [Patescibacteria group bacterium]
MITNIFVNLPTKDLGKSVAFFEKLGFTINPQFTDKNAACVVFGKNIYAMILTEEKFKEFTNKEITDSTVSAEAILALSIESKDKVDKFMEKALAAGAIEPRKPEVYDFMYGRGFEDLDGHLWEIFWMDPNHVEK